jgi:hypothetical protein
LLAVEQHAPLLPKLIWIINVGHTLTALEADLKFSVHAGMLILWIRRKVKLEPSVQAGICMAWDTL